MRTFFLSATSCWALSVAGCLVAGLLLTGCSVGRHTVIASTGTMLGVELTQDQATQSPRVKVGYNRAELALVPSNRSAEKDPGSRLSVALCEKCNKRIVDCQTPDKCKAARQQTLDGGAADTAEVLMEIRMQGGLLFSGIHDAGLYQRLAVGKTAVQQPGAALMFARDKAGTFDTNAASAVKSAVGADEEQRLARAREEMATQIIWVEKALQAGFDRKQSETERKDYFKVVLDMDANEETRDLTDERLKDRVQMRELLESSEWYPRLKKHFSSEADQP